MSFLISKNLRGDVAVWKCPCNDSGFSGYRKLHQSLLHSLEGMSGNEWGELVLCKSDPSVDKEALPHSIFGSRWAIWLGGDGGATTPAGIFCMSHQRTRQLAKPAGIRSTWLLGEQHTVSGNTASLSSVSEPRKKLVSKRRDTGKTTTTQVKRFGSINQPQSCRVCFIRKYKTLPETPCFPFQAVKDHMYIYGYEGYLSNTSPFWGGEMQITDHS